MSANISKVTYWWAHLVDRRLRSLEHFRECHPTKVTFCLHHGVCLTSILVGSTGFSKRSTLLAKRRRFPFAGLEWSLGTSKKSSDTLSLPIPPLSKSSNLDVYFIPGIWWVLFPSSLAAAIMCWPLDPTWFQSSNSCILSTEDTVI